MAIRFFRFANADGFRRNYQKCENESENCCWINSNGVIFQFGYVRARSGKSLRSVLIQVDLKSKKIYGQINDESDINDEINWSILWDLSEPKQFYNSNPIEDFRVSNPIEDFRVYLEIITYTNSKPLNLKFTTFDSDSLTSNELLSVSEW